ncbi:MAG: histidine kinase [Bacteroidia bacterium]|nr:histidine kinase [Bacteroidia bacterium]
MLKLKSKSKLLFIGVTLLHLLCSETSFSIDIDRLVGYKKLNSIYHAIDSLLDNYKEDQAELLIALYEKEIYKVEKEPKLRLDSLQLYKHKALYLKCVSRIEMAVEAGPEYDSATLQINKAYEFAKRSGDYKTISEILFAKVSHYQVEDKEQAIRIAKEALLIGQQYKDDTIQAKAYKRLGHLFLFGSSKYVMLEYMIKAMTLFERIGMYKEAGTISELIVSFPNSLTHKQKTLLYKGSIELYKKSGDRDKLAYSWEHLARFYSESKSSDTLQLAILFCDSAMLIWKNYPDHVCKINNLEIKAECYLKLGSEREYLGNRHDQLELAISKKDSTFTFSLLLLIADYFKEQANSNLITKCDSALYYFQLAEKNIPFKWNRYPIKFNSGVLSHYFALNLHNNTKNDFPLSNLPYLYYIKRESILCKLKAQVDINRLEVAMLLNMSDSVFSCFLESKFPDAAQTRVIKASEAEIREQDAMIQKERKDKSMFMYFSATLSALLLLLGFAIYKAIKANSLLKKSLEENSKSQSVIREQDRRFHEEQLAKLTIEQEMKVLRAQMNPHFIFNVLNSIHNCILNKDTTTASNNLTKFSKLIRKILDNSRMSLCSLRDEITTLELYVELEKMRFDGDFQFIINVDLEINMEELFLPPLIIQPFVENSIWHGLMLSQKPGLITLDVISSENHLTISVEDNGVGRDFTRMENKQKSHESVGVNLTADRLRYFNEGLNIDVPLKIIDLFDSFGNPSGTKVEIILRRQQVS